MRAKVDQVLCTLEFDTMPIEGGHFPALDAVLLLVGVVVTALHDPELHRDCLEVARLLVTALVEANMMKNANCIRVRSVNVLAEEVSLHVGLVELGQILSKDPHLDQVSKTV